MIGKNLKTYTTLLHVDNDKSNCKNKTIINVKTCHWNIFNSQFALVSKILFQKFSNMLIIFLEYPKGN